MERSAIRFPDSPAKTQKRGSALHRSLSWTSFASIFCVAYLTHPLICVIYETMIHRRSWKEFKGVGARRIPEAIRSSINPSGEITFDLDTFRKLGEPQAMFLLYEPSSRTIGLKPAHPDAENSVLVRIRHARSNRVVRSRPFMRENGIDIPTTLRFPYPYIEDNVLILDLRKAVTCGKGGWKKVKRRK